jgi:hypothetical protein
MFEDIVIDELDDGEGWLLSSICFLYYAFQLLFDGTNNPPVETQRVNWILHKAKEHRNYPNNRNVLFF